MAATIKWATVPFQARKTPIQQEHFEKTPVLHYNRTQTEMGSAHQQHGHADLQQDPHHDDDVAVDKEHCAVVERPCKRKGGE
jgi:hypothetical protein